MRKERLKPDARLRLLEFPYGDQRRREVVGLLRIQAAGNQVAFGFGASSIACLIAASMLRSSARPVPAMSNAVP